KLASASLVSGPSGEASGVNAARNERRSSVSKASVPAMTGRGSANEKSSAPVPGLLLREISALSNFTRPVPAVTLLDTETGPAGAPGAILACDHYSTRRNDGAENLTVPSR